jgi:hypothetical protein
MRAENRDYPSAGATGRETSPDSAAAATAFATACATERSKTLGTM